MKTIGIFMLAAALAAPAAAQDGYYQIKPGDVLSVSVLEDPNLSSQVLVRPDGRISLPIAGSVMAEGRSTERLEAMLRQLFSQGFELTPTVTVSLLKAATAEDQMEADETLTATYYFLGQVARPGPLTVEAEKPLSLLQAISVAGGPGVFADVDRVQIRRTGEDGAPQIITFDYSKIEDGLPFEDLELLDGDVVFFPERTLF